MKKFYKKAFKVPLYPTMFCVVISKSDKKINKFFQSQGREKYSNLKEYSAFVDEGVINDNKRCIYIVFRVFDEDFTHGLISHEVRHVTNKILDLIGHNVDLLNDEPEAYLSQWVTDSVYTCMKETGYISKLN